MRNKNLVIAYSILILIFFGCSSVQKTEEEQTVPPATKLAVWESNDAQSLSDSLISLAFMNNWKNKFTKKRKPIVVVGRIEDKSAENIDVSLIAKDIERSLINSGEVSFIADKQKREAIRTNRKNSSDFSKDKFKKYLKSLKSDFFIEGNISSIIDSSFTPVHKKYTLDLEILNTKNASVVWNGSRSITK